jgi:putative MATE family efflux protein
MYFQHEEIITIKKLIIANESPSKKEIHTTVKSFEKDLTTGSVPKNLFKFAIPVFLANVLSSGYAIVNTIWVGHLIGGIAVAAVAVSFPIVLFMVAIANGATTASSVMIAHSFGGKKNDEIQGIVNTSWSFGIILVFMTTLTGVYGAEVILKIMKTNDEVIAVAAPFLQLTIAQFGFMYIAFLLSSTLRAVGNSKIPLLFTALGTILNTILDPFLITGIGPFPKLGLNGAAVASLISSGITLLFSIFYLWKDFSKSPLVPKRIEFDPTIIRQIAGIGFPTFIQQSIISLSVGFITVFVNKFGPDATAAFGITGRVESLVIMPAIAMLVSVSTLTAQAIGAKKVNIVPKIYKWGLLINTPVIAIICLISIFIPSFVMHLFVADESIVAIGSHYLRIVGWGYLLLIFIFVNNGIFIGSKKAVMTMFFSIISLGVIRIPLAGFLSGTKLGISGIWIAIAASFFVNALLGIVFYYSGKWRPAEKPDQSKAITQSPEELIQKVSL